jgi:thioredoxin-related protein
MRQFSLWMLASFMLCGVVSFSSFAQDRPAQFSVRAKFDTSRSASADLAEAMKMAMKEKKNILLDVGGEWCIWCHRLDSLYLKNPDLEKYLMEHYVVVKINVSKGYKNEEFLSQFPKVDGYPHLFVLDAKGKVLQSQNTGDLEEGKGHSKEKVLAFLKKWTKK